MRRALVLLALLAAGCGGASQQAASPTLTNVRGIEDLATRVDAAAGKPRLVLILSPT